MAHITVHVDIAAPLEQVWREAADLASHAEWMADAESIEFLTDKRSGVGTQMKVATVVGPLRTNDLMEVTEWREGHSIGVRHSGLVTGTGRFELVAGGGRDQIQLDRGSDLPAPPRRAHHGVLRQAGARLDLAPQPPRSQAAPGTRLTSRRARALTTMSGDPRARRTRCPLDRRAPPTELRPVRCRHGRPRAR